jgi:hypothetical protein
MTILACAGAAHGQERTARIAQDAPLFLRPQVTQTPLLVMEAGVLVRVLGTDGAWLNVSVDGSQFGTRTGYVQAKFVSQQVEVVRATPSAVAASAAPTPALAPVASPRVAVAPPGAESTPAPAANGAAPRDTRGTPPAVSEMSLKGVRRIFIEKMSDDLDQYISAEITKELKGRVVVVLDKGNADAILRGVSENRTGTGAAITGRYLGLHDNASGSITLLDPAETVVLWASEAGDRSLLFGVLKRGGQRKVADRLVNNLKKALRDAK